jgi:hypothetical protein
VVEQDLNDLLRMAVQIKNDETCTKDGTITNFDKLIAANIMDILIKNRMIEKETIICGIYVSDLLAKSFISPPTDWVATDYMIKAAEEDNPFLNQQGANVCFLICSVFSGHKARTMKVKDYESFGIGMYSQFYHQTGQEIGCYMSNQFTEMTDVAKECMSTI